MGETAADTIIELIKGKNFTDYADRSVVFTPELNIRESTKKLEKSTVVEQ